MERSGLDGLKMTHRQLLLAPRVGLPEKRRRPTGTAAAWRGVRKRRRLELFMALCQDNTVQPGALPDPPVTLVKGIIAIMEVGDIRLYQERWKAVEEIEQQELRAMTLEEHWRKLNAIVRFAIETGMEKDGDDGEMEIFLRWAKLKARYEAGQKP
jgi:hypothetical protein